MSDATKSNELLTVGEVAAEIGIPVYTVQYAISQDSIQPRQRAGIYRLFGRDQITAIKEAVERSATRERRVKQAQK